MTIRIKSLVFKKDSEYKVFIKIYNSMKSSVNHIELADKAFKEGYKSQDLIAICDSSWKPFTLEVFPKISDKRYKKIYPLVLNKIKNKLREIKIKRDRKNLSR